MTIIVDVGQFRQLKWQIHPIQSIIMRTLPTLKGTPITPRSGQDQEATCAKTLKKTLKEPSQLFCDFLK